MSLPSASYIHLNVDLGERSYPIVIGQSLLGDVQLMERHVPGKRVAIVTNTVVGPLYLDRLKETLKKAGKTTIEIVLPDGEEEKTWGNLMRIYDVLLTEKCDRKITL